LATKVLVTGAAGYIGSHFVRRLLKMRPEVTVIALDNLSEGHAQSLPTGERIQFYELDLAQESLFAKVFEANAIDAVVHFAANAYVGESQENPFKYFDNNVMGSLNLFKAMEKAKVDKIVFSSSCATYGNPVYQPLDEEHPQSPVSVYGTTKLMIEQALRALSPAKGLSFYSLRYFNASGADDSGEIGESHDPETHLIPLALQVAQGKREFLSVFGDDYDTPDGTCVRDYVHVNDLADAHIAALDRLGEPGDAKAVNINLGSSVGASVKEVIEVCQKVTGKSVAASMCPRRAGDATRLTADYAKAKEELGWQPKYSLEEIVQTAWKWECNRRY
jgi:UDP-glucose 4-epimerase